VLQSFVLWNKSVCLKLTPRYYQPDRLYLRYDRIIAQLVAASPGQTVLDIGAGKWSSYAEGLSSKNGCTFIGLDCDADEMGRNPFLDRRLLADASDTIPLPDASVDLVISRATLEHIRDNAKLLRDVNRVLKPGGQLLCVFAGRNAPFAILNRMLPPRVTRVLLDRLSPDNADHLGFLTHYDRTTFKGFSGLIGAAGLRIDNAEVHYFSSNYFAFFLPVYALSLLTDALRAVLGIKSIASYYLFFATKAASP
jgi:SAM-dependent methyltransferase